jgi:hypothetical protein
MADGMPALNERPETSFALGPKWLESSIRIVFVNFSVVKNDPLSKVNTGKFFSTKTF